jgi:uncharacterized protein DUF955
MTHSNSERRKARTGRGLLPPNPKQWENEHNGLDLREDLGLSLEATLQHTDAFALLPQVTVLPHGAIPAAAKYIQHFRTDGRGRWSGLAIQLDAEHELVLYNDTHAVNRVRATLMEEFFHLRLGHPRSVVRVLASSGDTRSYDEEIEQAAYGSGAAALVPYAALKRMLRDGVPIPAIAEQLWVSDDLVDYRLKVTRLYRRANRRVARPKS